MSLCQYKNIFGVPRKGFHELRFLDLAALDLLGTLGIAILLVYFFYDMNLKNVTLAFLAVWALGTALHLLFCVVTPVTDTITRLLKK